MAFLTCNFFAESLGMCTSMNVILPQAPSLAQIGQGGAEHRERYPVLYLLHGWSDDETIWSRRTSIERYVAELPLIVVMPRVELSFYQNTKSGLKYWDYISRELPALCKQWFPVSDRREDTFAAGLSMGGYGAFRLGLSHPEKYAAVASLSGALDLARIRRDTNFRVDREAALNAIFGPDGEVGGTPSDLFAVAEELSESERTALRLYQCCGTEDFLYADNVKFRDHARAKGLNLTYEEAPGDHNWGFWDTWIQSVLQWLPIVR